MKLYSTGISPYARHRRIALLKAISNGNNSKQRLLMPRRLRLVSVFLNIQGDRIGAASEQLANLEKKISKQSIAIKSS